MCSRCGNTEGCGLQGPKLGNGISDPSSKSDHHQLDELGQNHPFSVTQCAYYL